MKTYAKIYESVTVVMNQTKDGRRKWRMSYNTLTRLLHDTQTKDAWKVTEPVFRALGLPLTRKVSRKDVESMIKVWHTDKKGNKYPAYIVKVADRDKDGNEVKDEKGEVVYHYETRAAKDGTWTFDKLAKVLAASNNAFEPTKKATNK